jgi:phospholipase/lecithinase/hemolysin
MATLRLRDRTVTRLVVPLLMACWGYGVSSQPAEAKLSSLANLIVIGDSYSDAGNSGLLTNTVSPPGYPYPYYSGGRYSNGPVALEQLWSQINPTLAPLKPSQAPGGTNYAVGGATSGINNYASVDPNMPNNLRPSFVNTSAYSQLSQVLGRFTPGSFDESSTLFAFWLGPNDALYWLHSRPSPTENGYTPGTITGGPPLQATGNELLTNLLGNISIGLESLIAGGAKHVLMPNLMDFSKAPAFSGDPTLAATIQALSLGFNQGLNQVVTQARAAHPDVDIISFDTAALFDNIFATPSSYGFSNTTQACTSITQPTTFTAGCSPTADGWLFWDGVHVTTAGHAVIASSMVQSVYDVPGPLPAIGGVVALGWARRLRCRLRQAGGTAMTVGSPTAPRPQPARTACNPAL